MSNLVNQLPDKVPTLDPIWSSSDSLGVKIEKVFTRFAQRVILWGFQFFAELMVHIFDASMKILQPGMTRMTKPFVDELKRTQGVPDWLKNLVTSIEAEQGESKVLGQIALFASMIVGPISGGFSPMGRVFSYGIDKNLRSARPTINEATELWRRGFLDDKTYNIIKEDMGIPNEVATALNGMMSSDVNPNDLIVGFWRGLFSETEFRQRLSRVGVPGQYHDLWVEKTKIIPGINDLIRMMVREAFNDATSAQFGYDDDYPRDIDKFLPMIGLNADWGKRFWRAHWTLPSPTQAYEMLHRSLISQDDLLLLLKTADYPSFWRDKLMKISYNVLTRIDVRRLLQAGIIDSEKARNTYLEMGYKPDDAQLLTDFAVQGISQDEKDLTKTDILNLYEEGLTTREATSANLIKMGYDSQEADEILKLSDVAIAKAARTDIINYVKERYQARQIDKLAAQGELSQAGLTQRSVDRYLLAWDRVNQADVSVPSVGDIRRWFLADYISELQLREYLKLHKHTPANIDIYVKEITDQKKRLEALKKEPEEALPEAVPTQPTVTDSRTWYLKDLITEQQLRYYLLARGYSEGDVDLYVEDANLRKLKAINEQAA